MDNPNHMDAESVNNALQNGDIDFQSIMQEIQNNPEKLQEIMAQYPEQTAQIQRALQTGALDPNTVAKTVKGKQALGNASTRSGREKEKSRKKLIQEHKKMKKDWQQQQQQINAEYKKVQVVLVNTSRKLKQKEVFEDSIITQFQKILKADDIKSFECPHLATGPLEGKTIYAVSNSQTVGKKGNKRVTALCRSPFSSEMVFYIPGDNISISD